MALSRIAHYHEHWDYWERCRETTCDQKAWDRWLCTKRIKVRNQPRYEVCPEVYYFPRKTKNSVGGPSLRGLDRRYGYGGYRCKHDGGMLRHESAPDPDQPIQNDELFEQIERLKLVAKEARKKNRGRKKQQPVTS